VMPVAVGAVWPVVVMVPPLLTVPTDVFSMSMQVIAEPPGLAGLVEHAAAHAAGTPPPISSATKEPDASRPSLQFRFTTRAPDCLAS
jgi:hypothetical protein